MGSGASRDIGPAAPANSAAKRQQHVKKITYKKVHKIQVVSRTEDGSVTYCKREFGSPPPPSPEPPSPLPPSPRPPSCINKQYITKQLKRPGDEGWHVEQVLMGNTEVEVQRKSNLIRIFTSSTFTDTKHERNILMEKAYPKLKSFCKQLGYEFQVVDMRWGVREEAEDDHMTTELCLKEIKACQTLSVGPKFVTFLSHKYGYRPFPRTILAKEFEKIFDVVETEEQTLLKKWYLKDENAIPAEYVLQRVSSRFPDFNSQLQERQVAARVDWWRDFTQLQKIIKKGAKKAFSETQQVHHFTMSVTEREIQHGLLNVHLPEKSCLWFKRNIKNIENVKTSNVLAKFIESNDEQGQVEEARNMMSNLKESMRSKLPERSVIEYNITWAEELDGVDPSLPEHDKYLNQLCEDFTEQIRSMTTTALREKRDSAVSDGLYEEVAAHTLFCINKCAKFSGRLDVLNSIETYIRGSSPQPLVVEGESGSGKTSIMAMAARNAWNIHNGNAAVVYRFIGTTLESSSIRPLLTSVVTQIMRLYVGEGATPRTELKYLVEDFRDSMTYASKKQPLVIILDSLDQLDSVDGGRHLYWLPRKLPANVYLVLSTLPQEQYGCYPRLRGLYTNSKSYISVPNMKKEDIKNVLLKWFESSNRTLVKNQFEAVLEALTRCPLPLFLKLTFDYALKWHSYNLLSDTVWTDSITTAIQLLFVKLENTHGRPLVRTALACLTVSQSGLSEGELEDILSLSDEVLNDVYQWWLPPIRRLPPLIWVRVKNELQEYLVERGVDGTQVIYWYHRQFIESARTRYLATADNRFKYHLALAEFFLGLWTDRAKPFINKNKEQGSAKRYVARQPFRFENGEYNLRKLNQLPHHLIEAGENTALKTQCLCNYEFLLARLCGTSYGYGGIRSILADLKRAVKVWPDDLELHLVLETLQLSQDALLINPAELAGQLVGRIHGTNSSNLISQAKDMLAKGKLPAEALPILNLLEAFEIQNQEKTKNLTNLLKQAHRATSSTLLPHSACLIPPGGQLMHKLSGHIDTLTDVHISRDGQFAVTGSLDNTAKIWNIKGGEMKQTVEFAENVGFVRFCHSDKWVAVSCWRREVFIVDIDIGTTITTLRSGKSKDLKELCMPIAPCVTETGEECLVTMRNVQIDIWDLSTAKIVKTVENKIQDWSSHHEGTGIEQRHLVSADHYVVYAGYRSHQFFIMNIGNPSNQLKVNLFEPYRYDKGLESPDFNNVYQEHISALCIDTNVEYVLVCNGPKRDVHICKLLDGEAVRVIKGDSSLGKLHSFFIPPCTNDWIYFLTKNMVGCWNIKKQKIDVMLPHPCRVLKVVGVDERIVVTIAEDGILRIWDRKKPPFHQDLSLFTGRVKVGSNESIAQAQQMFSSLFRDVVGDDMEHTPTNRDIQSMLTTEETLNYWTEPGKDEAVSDSPNSRFYQFRNGRYVGVSQSHPKKCFTFAFSIWDVTYVSCVRRIFFPHKHVQVHTLIDDETLVIVENRKLKLMDLKTWKIVRTLPGKTCGKWVPIVVYLKSQKELLTESQGGNLLKLLNVDSGRMVGALVPSKKSIRDYVKQARNNFDYRFNNLKVSHCESTACAQNGGPEIYVWNIAKRSLLHIVNPNELVPPPKDLNTAYDHSFYLSDTGRHVVVVLDIPKEAKPDTTKLGVFNVESGTSHIGYADLARPGDKYGGYEIVSVIRINKTKTLQILALNKAGKATILSEASISVHGNNHRFTDERTKLVTWSDEHKGRTVRLWQFTPGGTGLEVLGSFTPDLRVTDTILLDGGTTVLVDNSTGPTKLKLHGGTGVKNDINSSNSEQVLFSGVDLNVKYNRKVEADEDEFEEDEDPDVEIKSKQASPTHVNIF